MAYTDNQLVSAGVLKATLKKVLAKIPSNSESTSSESSGACWFSPYELTGEVLSIGYTGIPTGGMNINMNLYLSDGSSSIEPSKEGSSMQPPQSITLPAGTGTTIVTIANLPTGYTSDEIIGIWMEEAYSSSKPTGRLMTKWYDCAKLLTMINNLSA